jgi:hypothetical protein
MKKPVFVMCAVFVAFFICVTSFPCYAGKKTNNAQMIQPVGDDGIITGCYKKVNGQLRVINSTDICGPSEGSLSWNQTGQSGLIDLANTYVKTCQNTVDCFCDNDGWVLHGYAVCPANAFLSSAGTPMDASDYGFHALCMDSAGATVSPLAISIRCIGIPRETNCTDMTDNDGDGMIDCDDADCAGDPACMPVPVEICDDTIDNDVDGATDCADTDCASHPACLPVLVEICNDGLDNDTDGDIDCNDIDCTGDPACVTVGKPVQLENCTDSLDNDGDGLIDCTDSNCSSDPSCKKKKK